MKYNKETDGIEVSITEAISLIYQISIFFIKDFFKKAGKKIKGGVKQ